MNILEELEKLVNNKIISLQKEYFDVSETCQFLGISKSTLYKMNHRKTMSFFRPTGSKKIYYSKKDLINYLSENRFISSREMNEKANSYFTQKKGEQYVR